MTEIKRTLSLDGATRYIARVRAMSRFNVPSEWSEALDFTTPDDGSLPHAPIELAVLFAAPDLAISWTPPTSNTDGTPLRDLRGYNVYLTSGAITKRYEASSPRFVYTLEQNRLDFGTPKSTISVSVRAVDASGNESPPATIVAVNPAPLTPPTAPTASAAFTIIAVTMDPHSNDRVDVARYQLFHSTTGVPDSFFLLTETTNSSYTHEVGQGTTHYYQFKVIDNFEQMSAMSPVASATTLSAGTGADEDPPLAPTGLSATTGYDPVLQSAYIDLDWDPNQELDLSRYQLRYQRAGSPSAQNIDVDPAATTYRLVDLPPNVQYTILLYAFDQWGNRSDPSNTVVITTAIDNDPPDVPTGMVVTSGIETIYIRWNQNTENDFADYELYASTTTGFTPSAANLVFTGHATVYVQSTVGQQRYYFLLRAVDIYGNASEYTAEFSGESAATYNRDTTGPAKPTGLAVTATQELVAQVERVYATVTWNAVADPDLAGYTLRYRRTADGTTYTHVDIPKGSTSIRLYGLNANTQYGFSIAAYDTSSNLSQGGYSAEVTVTTPKDSSVPATPVLTATSGIRSIHLQWTANTEADFDHYEIHIGTTAGFTPTADNIVSRPIGTLEMISRYWTGSAWADLVPGNTYYFKMYAVDVSGNKSGEAINNATTGHVVAGDVAFSIGGVNPVVNSSFELDLDADGMPDSWSSYGAVITRATSTAQPVHGTKSMRFQATNIASGAGGGIQAAALIPVPPGVTKAVVSMYVHVPTLTGGDLRLHVNQQTTVGGNLGDFYLVRNTTTTALTRISTSVNLVTGTTRLKLYLVFQTSSATNSIDAYIDALQIDWGDLITAYAVRPNEILPGTITQTEIADNSITTPKLVSEAVIASKIAASSITAEKITIANAQPNIILNGGFEEVSSVDATKPARWTTAATNGSVAFTNTFVHSGQQAIGLTVTTAGGSNTASVATADMLPIEGNAVYEISLWAVATTAITSGLSVRIFYYNANGSSSSDTTLTVTTPTTPGNPPTTAVSSVVWQRYTAQFTTVQAPRATFRVQLLAPNVATTVYVDDVVLRRAVGPSSIEDLAVTDAKIENLTVTKLTAGVLKATVSMTSGIIRTADTGARIEIRGPSTTDLNPPHPGGIIAYATDGTTKNLEFKNSDGSLTLRGAAAIGGSITGATIRTGGNNLLSTNQADGTEDGTTTGFSVYLGTSTLSSSTVQAAQGTRSLRVDIASSVVTTANAGVITTNVPGVTAGRDYSVLVSVRSGAGNTSFVLSTTWLSAAGGELRTDTYAFTGSTGAWTNVSQTYNAPTNATQVRFRVTISHVNGTADTFYLDKMQVGLAPVLTWSLPNTVFTSDDNGVYLGNPTFSLAPFSVSMSGALIARNISIDTTGMAPTANVFQSSKTTLTAAGDLTVLNIMADGGRIGTTTITTTELQGGVIRGSTFNVENGGGINFTGTAGISWSAGATGGITVSNSGFVQSSNYSTTAGWKLDSGGLTINQGLIKATTLEIGVSSENRFTNGSFEVRTVSGTTYTTMAYGWTTYSTHTGTYTVDNTAGNRIYGDRAQKVVPATTGAGSRHGFYQDVVPQGGIASGTPIAVSVWVKQVGGTGRTVTISVDAIGGSTISTATSPALVVTNSPWTRVVHKFRTATAYSSGVRVYIWVNNAATTETFYLDGAQFEFTDFETDFKPAAGEIPDNYIKAVHIAELNADKITSGNLSGSVITVGTSASDTTAYLQSYNYSISAGYRLTSSKLTFQNGGIEILGQNGVLTMDSSSLRAVYATVERFKVNSTGVYLAGTLEVTSSAIQTNGFVSGAANGWQIKTDGSAEFNNVLVRGTLRAGTIDGIIGMASGGVLRTATTGKRWELSSAAVNEIRGYTGSVSELTPGYLLVDERLGEDSTIVPAIELRTGDFANNSSQGTTDTALLKLLGSGPTAGAPKTLANLNAQRVTFYSERLEWTSSVGNYSGSAKSIAPLVGLSLSPTLSGTATANGGGPYGIQAGTFDGAVNASGQVTITFPQAWPNCLLGMWVQMSGNHSGRAGSITHNFTACSLTAVTIQFYDPGPNPNVALWNGATLRFSWWALGC